MVDMAEMASHLESKRTEMRRTMQSYQGWDARQEEEQRRMTSYLCDHRAVSLFNAYTNFLLPIIAKDFPDWTLSEAFKLSELKLHVVKEEDFYMIQAPEISQITAESKLS